MALVKFSNSKKPQNTRAFLATFTEYWTDFYSVFCIAFFSFIGEAKFFVIIEECFFTLPTFEHFSKNNLVKVFY